MVLPGNKLNYTLYFGLFNFQQFFECLFSDRGGKQWKRKQWIHSSGLRQLLQKKIKTFACKLKRNNECLS